MSQTRAEFGHLVHLVDTLASDVVESVEVGFVGWYYNAVLLCGNGDDCFKDCALAVLNPLSHGVKVGRVVDSRRENAFVILALAFAVELLPPFAEEMELGVVVHQNFDFLAVAVEGVACHGVFLCGSIATVEGGFLHCTRTAD